MSDRPSSPFSPSEKAPRHPLHAPFACGACGLRVRTPGAGAAFLASQAPRVTVTFPAGLSEDA